MHRHTELPDGDEHLLSLQFSWGDELKSVSTSFIGSFLFLYFFFLYIFFFHFLPFFPVFLGVSPEFEVALYSLMFLVSGERTEVELDDFRLFIYLFL